MSKRYLVTLTESERAALGQRLSAGRAQTRELARARILLKADSGPAGPVWTDEAIAEALDVSRSTVERVRKRFIEHGLDDAIRQGHLRREYRMKLDREQEAHLVALACSPPPLGRRRRPPQLLADKLVELRYIDGVSYETVRQVLKKNKLKPWFTRRWCIPPRANAEFVWRMAEAALPISRRLTGY